MKTYIFPKVYMVFLSLATIVSTKNYTKNIQEEYENKLKTRNL
jgi:hypothetical protein